jgi:uncharacterized cupredoxin-like copper-binding protein
MNRRHLLASTGAGTLVVGILLGGRSLGLHAQEGTPDASPAASPGATPGAADEVTVDMVDIDFNPNEFSIPADTDVTVHLPNKGAAIHNFNIDAKNNPSDPGSHSGDVPPGEETTITINLPAGDWYYYCSIPGHEAAGMHGIVHVG